MATNIKSTSEPLTIVDELCMVGVCMEFVGDGGGAKGVVFRHVAYLSALLDGDVAVSELG
jgi:hypothetical protein